MKALDAPYAGASPLPRRAAIEEIPTSWPDPLARSEEHTSELQSQSNLVCRLLLEKKKQEVDKTKKPDCIHLHPTSQRQPQEDGALYAQNQLEPPNHDVLQPSGDLLRTRHFSAASS